MSETVRAETHFRGDVEAPELEGYRPISPLVIVACIVGLASVLAIVHPLLWIVPIVAAVLSICAIVRVSAAQSRYGGRSAAIAALCFAVFIGSYAPARTISRERALYEQARLNVEAWLSLLQQGRVQEAHQLSLNEHERFQGPASLADHYAEVPPPSRMSPASQMEAMEEASMQGPPPAVKLKGFVAEPVVAKLLEFGEQARIEHLKNVQSELSFGTHRLTLRYRAAGVHAGQPESIEFLIRAMRNEGEKLATWSVGNLELVK